MASFNYFIQCRLCFAASNTEKRSEPAQHPGPRQPRVPTRLWWLWGCDGEQQLPRGAPVPPVAVRPQPAGWDVCKRCESSNNTQALKCQYFR